MPELLTYSKFYTNEEAEQFAELLAQSEIEFKIEHERDLLDKIYIGETLDPMFSVKIPEDRFEEANKILVAETQSQLSDIDPNYYLFNFSDNELIEVLKNKKEWNLFDQAIAQKVLSARNVEISKDIEKIFEPDFVPIHLEKQWLFIEYLLTIVLGYAGIIIGLVTISSYKTLKNGKRVKMYDSYTLHHARIMLIIGVIRTLASIMYLIL